MTQQDKTVLSVHALHWQINDKPILADIHFNLQEGQVLGIIGPNGAGKSSLLRCLYRYFKPTSGHIQLFNQNMTALSSRAFAQKVAVVLQDTPQHFDMTTRQLVALGLTPHKGVFDSHTELDDAVIDQALYKVGLTEKGAQVFESLSGGEKQRALIARAIVQDPQLLILDEPTNHLDIRYQIQILELLRSLKISVIISIHDLNLASALCDSLVLLEKGHLIAQGSPNQVLTEATISSVFDVCCEVHSHPQHGKPLICYFYGYDNDLSCNHDKGNHHLNVTT
ncbi:ABC transporter ATP-binding protein [Shewanella surugensis]|uniref:ABC transporter ATP-binding protein n=1 Tax=Shewanella surugensis TaxID=212020 RepID=A0ABT0LGU9_9GAMM|nr:ABC transporter ATP-binding protein [Shewanella surugensis]MCL1126890.1 ABC transporter ATP-binding protein [Shewanella surugensis]